MGRDAADWQLHGVAGKLPFSGAPPDDRSLPDMHLALYNDVLVFDHATKLAYVISWVHLEEHGDVDAAYQVGSVDRRAGVFDGRRLCDRCFAAVAMAVLMDIGSRFGLCRCSAALCTANAHDRTPLQAGRRRLERLVARITDGRGAAALPSGRVSLSLSHRPQPPGASNMSREQYLAGVAAAQVLHFLRLACAVF